MTVKKLITLGFLSATLAACGGGGDIVIAPENNSGGGGNNNGGGGDNGGDTSQCASYTDAGATLAGTMDDDGNCTYSKAFVDIANPLEVDLELPDLDGGVHIFEGSLVVGRAYNLDADLEAAGISAGGDGPTLTIPAGATLAFGTSDNYMVVNRGAQLIADGAAGAPVTLTSFSDAVLGSVGPEDVSQWGGLVINGFGVTNKCAYDGTYPDVNLSSECHVVAEGQAGAGETYYGGENDADNSGVMTYFIVKHTGAEVAPGNELNGIAFNAVGSGTVVENLQAYSTFDDGIEFFGGAVDITNYIALYVRDDSIDIDEGYRGTITNALVIQSEFDGNRCMESDGIGSYDAATSAGFIAQNLHSQATVTNLTCIISPETQGTHDPGQGLRIREGHMPTIQNALVTSAYMGDETLSDPVLNFCLRIDDEGEQAALDGDLVIESSIFACQDLTEGDLEGSSTEGWARTEGNAMYQSAEEGEDPTATSAPDLVLLDGYYSVPAADMVATGETIPAPVAGSSIIGAVSADDDWTAGWAYGLEEGNRGQPLWFVE